MTYQCRAVLRGIRKIANSTDIELSMLDGTTEICGTDQYVTYNYVKYANEIRSIIDHLVLTGYLKYGSNESFLYLTHKGLHPYGVKWDEIKSFLIKSVLVPIGVSFVTALLTLWLTGQL